jgi:hypothetical protein
MVPALFFYQLVLVALVWLFLMLQWAWSSDRVMEQSTPSQPAPPRRTRSREPKPFAGLTTKPLCDACEHASAPYPHAPSAPPPRLVMARGRRRQVDTSRHFCPQTPPTHPRSSALLVNVWKLSLRWQGEDIVGSCPAATGGLWVHVVGRCTP